MGLREVWLCGDCAAEFHQEYLALECCAPEPELRFECPDCEELHDDEEAASSCCGASARCPVCMRDHSGGSIDAVAVAIAGHCRSCRPHYDVDQQLVIEAQFEERTGTFESLNK